MTKEEVKQEILNDEQQQTNITINAQFIALYTQLIKKGLFVTKDLDEMNELTKEYIDKLNDKIADKVLEQLKNMEDK